MDDAALELSEAYDLILKTIIIGEASCGKTCLIHHFMRNQWKENATHTIGVEFSSRTVKVGDKNVKLQLWDTAGQERFRSVTRSYYRGAAGALLVYDITRRSTFETLQRWLSDARALASSDLCVVLVGNKLDREEEREVGYLEASRWASDNGALFLETSSLTGQNVEAPFALCARSILLAIESGKLDPEKAGSGISYGDRRLRRVGSGNSGSRFSFAFHDGASETSRRGGLIRLKESVGLKGDGCC